MIANLSFSNKV